MVTINIKSKINAPKVEKLKTQIDKAFNSARDAKEVNEKRYKDSWKYYIGKLPEPYHGQTYVEPVLRDACNKIMPSLLNIFTENEVEAVTFRPLSKAVPRPVISAVNRKINDIFLRENDGYNIMSTAFKEALVSGDTFIKTYISEEVEEQELTLEDWTPVVMVADLLNEWPDTDVSTLESKVLKEKVQIDAEILDESDVPEDKRYQEIPAVRGSLVLRKVHKLPIVEPVPYSDIFVDDQRGVSIQDARYLCQVHSMTISEAIDMGFKKEDLEDAAYIDDFSDEVTKDLIVDTGVSEEDQSIGSIDEMERLITIKEHYIYSSVMDNRGKTYLYQVYSTSNGILSVNRVERIPFIHGVKEIIPSSFWGYSLFDEVKAYQDQLSHMTRLASLNVANNVLGIWQVVKGSFDRQSFIGMRPGSVVEVQQPGAITPMVQQPLPASFDGLYSTIANSKDNAIATSVGQALDAGSLTNVAAQTMNMAIHNSELKDKQIAKVLARTLVRPIFVEIYNMIREEDLPIELDEPIDDQGTAVIPASSLPDRPDFYIDVNTANDNAAQAMQLVNMAQTLGQVSQMPNSVITPANLYAMGSTILRNADITNVDDYLTNPATQQPSPEEIAAQQEAAAMDAEAKRVALETAKVQHQIGVASLAKLEVETRELIKNNSAERERAKEKSVCQFERLKLDKFRAESDVSLTKSEGREVAVSG